MKHFFIVILLTGTFATAFAQDADNEFEALAGKDCRYLLERLPLELKEDLLAEVPPALFESGPFQRWLWEFTQHVGKDGSVTSREEMWKSAQPFFEAEGIRVQSNPSIEQGTHWTNVGPVTQGGRTLAIALHPLDTSIVYAGAAGGGVWKTTNSGTSWIPLTDHLPTLAIGSLAVVPGASGLEEIYAGTGENCGPVASRGNYYRYAGSGLYYSRDAGATWEKATGLNQTANSEVLNVTGIAVDPTNDNIIYASIGNAKGAPAVGPLFVSTDRGITWSHIDGGLPVNVGSNGILINPLNANIMYLNLSASRKGDTSHGVWRTTDKGISWSRCIGGFPASGINIARMWIALCASQPNVLCAIISDTNIAAQTNRASLYLTTDGGDNWKPLTMPTGGFLNGQGWYDLVCAIKADDPNRIIIGGSYLAYTTNQGSSWTKFPYNSATTPHPDQHALAVSVSNPSIIWLGNDGGNYCSTNGGINWKMKDSTYITTQFYAIDVDRNPGRYDLTIGGLQDNGTRRAGGSFPSNDIFGGDGFYTAIDYTNPAVLYAEVYYGDIGRSTNGTNTNPGWVSITPSQTDAGDWCTPFIIDPVDHATLYYVASGIYKTTDRGNTWTLLTTNPEKGSTIAVAPSNTQYVLAGYYDGGVYLSTDAGTVWTPVINGFAPGRGICSRVAFDPSDPKIAYATFGGGGSFDRMYRTTDGCLSWQPIMGDYPHSIPVRCFLPTFEASSGNALYAGGDMGVFKSVNGGLNWFSVNNNMGNQYVYDFKVTPDNRLRVATFGRGIWEIPMQVDSTSAVRDPRVAPRALILSQNYPNPVSMNSTIHFELPRASQVTLTVHDALGRIVRTLAQGSFSAGSHHVLFRKNLGVGESLAAGIYTYRIATEEGVIAKKMIVTK